MKHATFLRLSNLRSELALRKADLHYQQANIDMKIQEYLTTCQVQSVTQSVGFIMATDIGLFILKFVNLKCISHQVYAEFVHLDKLVPSQSLSKTHA